MYFNNISTETFIFFDRMVIFLLTLCVAQKRIVSRRQIMFGLMVLKKLCFLKKQLC